jgi:hypothetical protein
MYYYIKMCKKLIFKIFFLLVFVYSISNCLGNPSPSMLRHADINMPEAILTNNVMNKLPDFIYLAGSYNEGRGWIPCYWQDSNRVSLPVPVTPGAALIHASTITVANGIVYTAGNYSNQPCYWEGTNRIYLTVPDGVYGFAQDIKIINRTVYIAGSYVNQPCYWEGMNRVDLPFPKGNGSWGLWANAITVVNGIVYTAGSYYAPLVEQTMERKNNTHSEFMYYGKLNDSTDNWIAFPVFSPRRSDETACYWEGTMRIDLPVPVGARGSSARAINVSNGTVYAAGSYFEDGTEKPCYWKGTTRIDLSVPLSAGGVVRAITVVDGIVYTAGSYIENEMNKPCYWENTTRIDLPVPVGSRSSFIRAISVIDGMVYSVGTIGVGNTSSNVYYWEDNTLIYSGIIDGSIFDVFINK